MECGVRVWCVDLFQLAMNNHLYYNSVSPSVCLSVCHSAYSSETTERIYTKIAQMIAYVSRSAQKFFSDVISKTEVTRGQKVMETS